MNKLELIYYIATKISGQRKPPIPLIMYLVKFYKIEDPLSLNSISILLGISVERVSQIHQSALKKLGHVKYFRSTLYPYEGYSNDCNQKDPVYQMCSKRIETSDTTDKSERIFRQLHFYGVS